MQNMLEQALVDASALKEAALENARETILEKYSVELKDAMNTLLEQEDEPMMDLPDLADPEPSMAVRWKTRCLDWGAT